MQQYSALSVFVTIGGKLLTLEQLNCHHLEISDEDEGDSEVSLECVDNDYAIADSALLQVGQVLSIKFGYSGGVMSDERGGYVVMKPATSYSKEGVLTTITATTKSATLAARRPQKSFGPTSLHAIVADIAKRNSLQLSITGGGELLSGFSQGTWSDRQTLRVLADRFGYQCTYQSNTIVFAPRDYGKVPALELIFKRGEDSTILQADVSVDAKKEDEATKAVSVDPASKQVKTAVSGEATKSLAISADNGHSWSLAVSHTSPQPPPPTVVSGAGTSLQGIATGFATELTNTPSLANPPDIHTLMSSPDLDNLGAHATADKLVKQKKKAELTVVAVGQPKANSRALVHISGLARRDSGNWYATTVAHVIDQSEGFTTKFELNRRGNNSHAGEKNIPPVNNQTASSQQTKVVTATVVSVSADTGLTGRQ